MSNYARMLIELLGKPDPNTPLHPDQLRYAAIEGAESIYGCKHMASLLFSLIKENHGVDHAWRIFARFHPPTLSEQQDLEDAILLDLYDIRKPEKNRKIPNIRRFADEQAKANEARPEEEKRGARSDDPVLLAQHIRRLRRKRRKAIKAGKWRGPFPS